MGLKENGYGMMTKVEETLAAYLSPDAVLSLKAPTLPIKPCRTTSYLAGKVDMAASQAGTCLHTIEIMQAYQADLLRDLDEVEEVGLLLKSCVRPLIYHSLPLRRKTSLCPLMPCCHLLASSAML